MTDSDGQSMHEIIMELKDEIAAQRMRTRKALLWFFLFMSFAIFASVVIVLGAGLAMLRQTGAVVENMEWWDDQMAAQSVELGGISNRVSQLSRAQRDLSSRINSLQLSQQQALNELQGKTDRQQRWITSRETQFERERVGVDERFHRQGEVLDDLAASMERLENRLQHMPSEAVEDRDAVVDHREPAVSRFVPDDRPPWAALLDSFEGASISNVYEEVIEHVDGGRPSLGVSRTISVVEFPNDDRYEGSFERGLMHGWGQYTHRNGDRYEGQFEHDLRHGNGTLILHDGTRYEGQFVRGIRQGLGRLTRPDGTRYAGEFSNDMINGRGVKLYANGAQYGGEFLNNKRHGHGVHRFANGDVYKGEFRQDMRTGTGLYVFTDGSSYEGNFVEGVRHGQGHYRFADGSEYIGEFQNGLMHGEGRRIVDGESIRGLWRKGEHVRDI